MARPPRPALALAAALAAPLLASCSTGAATEQAEAQAGTDAEAGAFPVTIEHAFGETTIEEEPTRVATLGWVDQDHALALGVVPVGATQLTWGGNEGGSSDWFDAALEEEGAEPPVRWDDADGAPIEDVAAADPDVILATNSGITEEEYEKLSRIAPVVAYPEAPWTTRWQDSLDMVGQALGRSGLADEVEADTEAAIDEAAADHPQLDGASLIFGYLTTTDLSTVGIYAPEDPRVALMHDLGLVDAPAVDDAIKPGQFYGTVSAEHAPELESDVFLTWSERPDDMETFAEHDLIGRIPAIDEGHAYAEEDKHVSLAVTNPTPLSIPYVIEHFVPEVAEAIEGA
ncbi:MAG TPA: ABC transporter substrate-binding protein [Nocardioides sp.]|nr:ABC transporter substrate-binding protein [Nocardioides sp.]